MMKLISLIVFVIGLIVSVYGAITDFDPISIAGALAIVTALILFVYADKKKN